MNKKDILRAVKFTLFSISAGVIQIGSFTLLNELTGWSYWPCHLISLTLSVLWNFTLNRKFTFQSAANVPIAMLKTLGYYVVFTPLSSWLGEWLTADLLWNEYIVEALVLLLNFVTEFLFQRFFVFGNSLDTNKKAETK
jgi:putative flippase GtrA